jgi:formylmethanofuran dehydrogenase subunit D
MGDPVSVVSAKEEGHDGTFNYVEKSAADSGANPQRSFQLSVSRGSAMATAPLSEDFLSRPSYRSFDQQARNMRPSHPVIETVLERCASMTRKHFLLIAGRTSKQGCGISEGKETEGYLAETTTLQMSPEDMVALGLSDGKRVRLSTNVGRPFQAVEARLESPSYPPHIDLPVISAKGGELPGGVLFIAYGSMSSLLMEGETHGSGMPTSKGIDVVLETLP